MACVEITGWQQGFRAAVCTQLLCSSAGLAAADAKRIVAGVLAGNRPQVSVRSNGDARMLVMALEKLGASARVMPA